MMWPTDSGQVLREDIISVIKYVTCLLYNLTDIIILTCYLHASCLMTLIEYIQRLYCTYHCDLLSILYSLLYRELRQ